MNVRTSRVGGMSIPLPDSRSSIVRIWSLGCFVSFRQAWKTFVRRVGWEPGKGRMGDGGKRVNVHCPCDEGGCEGRTLSGCWR